MVTMSTTLHLSIQSEMHGVFITLSLGERFQPLAYMMFKPCCYSYPPLPPPTVGGTTYRTAVPCHRGTYNISYEYGNLVLNLEGSGGFAELVYPCTYGEMCECIAEINAAFLA